MRSHYGSILPLVGANMDGLRPVVSLVASPLRCSLVSRRVRPGSSNKARGRKSEKAEQKQS
jgi:hypothetical protein